MKVHHMKVYRQVRTTYHVDLSDFGLPEFDLSPSGAVQLRDSLNKAIGADRPDLGAGLLVTFQRPNWQPQRAVVLMSNLEAGWTRIALVTRGEVWDMESLPGQEGRGGRPVLSPEQFGTRDPEARMTVGWASDAK